MKINQSILFCTAIATIVFVFFAHTLNYPWRFFDEQIIYNETVFPIPSSFSQIFEYISRFGLNHHFEASNVFYSTISNIRCNPFNTFISLVTYYFFQKNAFAYHAFSLILHMINSCLLFLLMKNICREQDKTCQGMSLQRNILISILTLFWALHPVNVESVLFAANWAAILSYCLCLLLMIYFNFYIQLKKNNYIHAIGIFILTMIPLLNSEYSIMIPPILFLYAFSNHSFNNSQSSFKTSFSFALKKNIPTLTALMIFLISFFYLSSSTSIHRALTNNNFIISIERIFWLSPQIFFHYLKLIFFPLHLSIDQPLMVKLSTSLFEPYAIFCTVLMYSLISLLLVSFFFLRRTLFYFLFSAMAYFFIALIPFLQILSPSYCLASERYLYFPLLMLVFGGSHFILSRPPYKDMPRHVSTVFLCLTLCLFGTRSYFRTLDWKDSFALFDSALKEAPNPLIKGLRLEFIGSMLLDYSKDGSSQNKGKEYIAQAIKTLQNGFIDLEVKKLTTQDKVPQVLKYYGLDPKTIQTKIAYLLAFTKLGLEKDPKGAYEILSPYMQDLSITDTEILDMYLGLLFSNNNLDEAERLLDHALKTKFNSSLLNITAQLHSLKYNDFKKAEEYLKTSFKYFPYDTQTLSYLKNFYQQTNRSSDYAYYSFLYGLRTHSYTDLENAFKTYASLNNTKMTAEVLKSLNSMKSRVNQ